MARKPRLIVAGLAHHITQRGNNRQQVFFTDSDRWSYLDLLEEHTAFANVRILGYCLMTNHTHLILVPTRENSLERCLQRIDSEYAARQNRTRSRSGHFWQGRYKCSVMDDKHLWAGLRYVEQNPVRSGLVASPEDWRWSSARDHLGLRCPPLIQLDQELWSECFGIPQWTEFLKTPTRAEELSRFRTASRSEAPIASEAFCLDLERTLSRPVFPRKKCKPVVGV